MFPLKDDIQSIHFPFINYVLIGCCILSFLLQMQDADRLVDEFGMVPALVSHPDADIVVARKEAVRTPRGTMFRIVEEKLTRPVVPPFMTLLTCTFLHGNFMHLLGNVWFLYIFGDNVEDRMGKAGYLAFYLGSGIIASLAHFVFQPQSPIPTIGASGAVAGVMGAYMWLYPRARVTTVVPLIFILHVMILPASLFLGIWFLIQLVQGTFSMGAAQAAGVAWWAHAGGFAFGFLIAKIVGRDDRSRQPRVVVIKPSQFRRR